MYSALAEHDVHFVRDVSYGSDVRLRHVMEAEYISSLRPKGATSLLPLTANTSLSPLGQSSLYKQIIICYHLISN